MLWRSVCSSFSPAHTVRGTLLETAIVPGTRSRFALHMIRAIDRDRALGLAFHVADAEAITDADVRAGKRPPIVFKAATEDAALTWVAAQAL